MSLRTNPYYFILGSILIIKLVVEQPPIATLKSSDKDEESELTTQKAKRKRQMTQVAKVKNSIDSLYIIWCCNILFYFVLINQNPIDRS